MNVIRKEIRTYFLLLRASIRAQMQYRADFVIGIVGNIIYNVLFLISIGFILNAFQSLNGWTIWEIVFLYSLFMLSHAFYGTFLFHITSLSNYVMQGTLDPLYMRPISIITQILGSEISFSAIINLIIGIAGMVLSYIHLQLDFSLVQWFLLPVFILAGVMVEFCCSWSLSCLCFWVPNSQSLHFTYWQFILVTQRYPIDIFNRAIQALMTWIIPVGFINYYPALFLLGKPSQIALGNVLQYMSPAMAMVLLCISLLIWRHALRNYSSTGS